MWGHSARFFQLSDGRFDLQGYRGLVQYTLGTTPRNFEEEIRENLIIRKLLRQAVQPATVSEGEIAEAFRQEKTAIRVTSLAIPHPDLAQELLEALRQAPSQMEALASQLEQKPVATSFFKKEEQVPQLGVSGSALASLFGKETGEVDGPFRTSKGWLVARLEEKQTDPQAETTEKDRERLREQLSSRKQMTAYLAWYQDLLGRAKPKRNLLPGNETPPPR